MTATASGGTTVIPPVRPTAADPARERQPPPSLTCRRRSGQGGPGAQGGPSGQPGLGGLLDARVPGPALVTVLRDNADAYTWAAATVGANNAAGLQLASGKAVLAVGGFNGTDPAPTLVSSRSWSAPAPSTTSSRARQGPGAGRPARAVPRQVRSPPG